MPQYFRNAVKRVNYRSEILFKIFVNGRNET